MKKYCFMTISALLFVVATMAQGRKQARFDQYSIAFYNLENLFDTIHDEGKNDYDFLPDGRYTWGTEKYEAKLKNLARVLSELSRNQVPQGPACIGVAEVEKRMKIRAYCERLQTAYNQKDIDFINQIFSDDALIITGTVVSVKPMEDRYANKLKVVYKKQNKEQYIANLKKAFLRNKWIDVKLSDIEENGNLPNACAGVTRSKINPNMFGVRLRQEWRSSNYSDVGYLFLLWDFTDEDKPVIHVRTWQPEFVGNVRQEPDVNISTLGAFDL